MTTVIYADSLLLTNFSMDFLALFVASRMAHLSIRPLRMAGAAGLGAVFALFSVLAEPYIPTLLGVILWALCALVMSAAAFGGRMSEIFRSALMFGAVSISLGGIMTALYSLLGRAADKLGLICPETGPEASPLLFVIIVLISGAVSLLYGRIRVSSAKHAEVLLTAFGGSLTLTVLCDTGNLLREPISGRPVIVVSLEAVRGILPKELCGCAVNPASAALLTNEAARRVRLIPTGGVGSSTLLLGILPDRLEYRGRELDVVIAIDSKSEDFDGCGGIIPASLIS